jgi:hypothetical protein
MLQRARGPNSSYMRVAYLEDSCLNLAARRRAVSEFIRDWIRRETDDGSHAALEWIDGGYGTPDSYVQETGCAYDGAQLLRVLSLQVMQ